MATEENNIGKNIRKARKNAGMTQEELGKKVGVTSQNISRYESGVIPNISPEMINKLAYVLETNPLELLGFDLPKLVKLAQTEEYESFESGFWALAKHCGINCRTEEVIHDENWSDDVYYIDVERDGKRYKFQPDLSDITTLIGKIMLLIPDYLITELSVSGSYEVENIE